MDSHLCGKKQYQRLRMLREVLQDLRTQCVRIHRSPECRRPLWRKSHDSGTSRELHRLRRLRAGVPQEEYRMRAEGKMIGAEKSHRKVSYDLRYMDNNKKGVIEHGLHGLHGCARIKRIRENPSNPCHPCSMSDGDLLSYQNAKNIVALLDDE